MISNDKTGKRAIKRRCLEAAVEFFGNDQQEHVAKGLPWANVTKAALQKRAGVGKNYIDMLDPADELAKKIKPLLRRVETARAKRDVEQTRLDLIRRLERQLAFQALENQELMSQLNRTRSDLERALERLGIFERHYDEKNRPKPHLLLVESDKSAEVFHLLRDEPK